METITAETVREALEYGHVNLVGDPLDDKGRPRSKQAGEIEITALVWLAKQAARTKVAVEQAITVTMGHTGTSNHPSVTAAQAILTSLALRIVDRVAPQRLDSTEGHWEVPTGFTHHQGHDTDPAWVCVGERNDPQSGSCRWYIARESVDEELAGAWEEASGHALGQQPAQALGLALLALARRVSPS
jgi:hypothetical protein